jgi:hypothetical protein
VSILETSVSTHEKSETKSSSDCGSGTKDLN